MRVSVPKNSLTILGATGSIGVSTLDVVSRHPDRFEVHALTAHANLDRLAQQCAQFNPARAVIGDPSQCAALQQRLASQGLRTVVEAGPAALASVAADSAVDTVMAAIVGAAGLQPTLAAARAGKRILLANKEALVMAGPVFLQEVARGGASLLPIDSEHNAVFQCMPLHLQADASGAGAELRGVCSTHGVRRIVLTASGGPFRTWAREQMADVTPEQAVAHPNWSMGRKISVDSATMMNKGLELIEAQLLFGLPASALDVLVHPESVIHSMVEYIDGSTLAQLGHPDMRTPIAQAMAFPQRVDTGMNLLDLAARGQLRFEAPDEQRFPCLRLARHAMTAGGAIPTLLNAANEIAVDAFLNRIIGFNAIAEVTDQVLQAWAPAAPRDLDEVLAFDAHARVLATTAVKALAR